MKLLYAARIARFGLLRSINNLARNVTKWSKKDDVRLHHLMCYVNSSKSKKMIGWVGDDLSQLTIDIYIYIYMQMMLISLDAKNHLGLPLEPIWSFRDVTPGFQ